MSVAFSNTTRETARVPVSMPRRPMKALLAKSPIFEGSTMFSALAARISRVASPRRRRPSPGTSRTRRQAVNRVMGTTMAMAALSVQGRVSAKAANSAATSIFQ